MVSSFVGAVSDQAETGEAVKITVNRPDGEIDILTCLTDIEGTFNTNYETSLPGDYVAVGRIEEDAVYQAAESEPITFTMGKEPRAITLHWVH